MRGTNLSKAKMPEADLRRAEFSGQTLLDEVQLADERGRGPRIADVQWGTTILSVIEWTTVSCTGDETWARYVRSFIRRGPHLLGRVLMGGRAQQRADKRDKRVNRQVVLTAFQDAARANRQLATALRLQGITGSADHFAYRAQVLQCVMLFRQRRFLRYLGSCLLGLITGYGYRPLRSLVTYVATIILFAVLYWCVTNDFSLTHGLFTHIITSLGMQTPPPSSNHLQGYEAVVVSMTSFHGRGFFQPIQSPGDKVAILSAIEAAIGLLLEITFIATFTQRFFAR